MQEYQVHWLSQIHFALLNNPICLFWKHFFVLFYYSSPALMSSIRRRHRPVPTPRYPNHHYPQFPRPYSHPSRSDLPGPARSFSQMFDSSRSFLPASSRRGKRRNFPSCPCSSCRRPPPSWSHTSPRWSARETRCSSFPTGRERPGSLSLLFLFLFLFPRCLPSPPSRHRLDSAAGPATASPEPYKQVSWSGGRFQNNKNMSPGQGGCFKNNKQVSWSGGQFQKQQTSLLVRGAVSKTTNKSPGQEAVSKATNKSPVRGPFPKQISRSGGH